MILKRPERKSTEETLPDALVTIAASLQDARSAEEVLNRLTRGLSARGIACALFVQAGEGPELLVERSTLPLTPDVWGRPLRLPRLATVLKRGRPSLQSDVAASFSEAPGNGKSRSLLSENVEGPVATVPLRRDSERGAVLCLTSSELSRQDLAASWGLAMQLGSALREAEAGANVQAPSSAAAPIAEDPPLFHELTRRLSYSLSAQEAIRIGLEVLAPALHFQAASSVACHGGEDTTTVYSPEELPERAATRAAAETLNAFILLTGEKHRSCQRPQFKTETLAMAARNGGSKGKLESVLDAPLVTGGEVNGLLRIASAEAEAFGAAEERTFYTVANQVSLALERVSAQQQAERAHLASLAESLSDGIVLVDAELRVTSLNSAAKELLALLDGSLELGATLTDASLAALAREALSSRAATGLGDLPEAEGPAGRRYLVAMAAPLAGSPEGSAAVVILRDVTEERLMQERLLQSEKMVSVGQLVSGVAHEINNPLTGIIGFAQLILLRDLDEQTKSEVNTILTEADRAAKIVQNLLTFARRKRAEKELANLNVLLERVLELRTYELRVKNIEIEVDLDPRLPDTMVDATQIQQVMFNIINNAEHAIVGATDQGVLKVRTSLVKDAIRLSFQDNGAGMSAETIRRIFDPFFTTKETGEGTGLGLTISYGIIDEHGGRIWAESEPGRGTTFIIELPVVQGAGQPAGGPADEEQAASVTGRSILVVDDEENIRRLLSGILQMDGHHVDTAGNGREALERIGRRRYDMVITDIKMPDMDGRELYQRLLDRDRGLASRTIFITGDTVSSDTRSFLERVRNPCLAKPFRVREVRETIAGILGEAK